MFLKFIAATMVAVFVLVFPSLSSARGYTNINDFHAHPPIHIYGSAQTKPAGITPAQVKQIYNLPSSGGKGTIAIIGAYNDKTIEADLKMFDKQFKLPACTKSNGCLTQHLMSASTSANSGWAMETSLDVEWAHAIAPKAKILLVEGKTDSGANLLAAVDYAASRSDVVAVSMSWGGAEFASEAGLDAHFSSSYIVFFASSGDDGAGVSWPAVSKNVVSVGGTSLTFDASGKLKSEKAWSGSGGGVSAYEPQPIFQASYSIPKASGMRAVPDVSYDADPASGFSIYDNGKWYVVGGTSAGAPQWAAIQALGLSATANNLYTDKSLTANAKYFRDITSGSNGNCIYYCVARKHYDYVTGLGSPLTVRF